MIQKRLLIFTQKIDINDPVLGFFHKWVEKISYKIDKVYVVCLEVGEFSLPDNVTVLSLGKERGRNKVVIVFYFYIFLLKLKNDYDTVFIHMNKEYVLLGFWWWFVLGKKIILWYNHPFADIWAKLAGKISNIVLCTSDKSYFGRTGGGKLMPVGIDVDIFKPLSIFDRKNFVYVGRISPVKRVDKILAAVDLLLGSSEKKYNKDNTVLDIYGGVSNKDKQYGLILGKDVDAYGGAVKYNGEIVNQDLPGVYNKYSALVNVTEDGSFDKVILEAMSCGILVISSNSNYRHLVPECYHGVLCPADGDTLSLAECMKTVLALSVEEYQAITKTLREVVVNKHSLDILVDRLLSLSFVK